MVDHVTPITPKAGAQKALIDVFQEVAEALKGLDADALMNHDESARYRYVLSISKAVAKELPVTDAQKDVFHDVILNSLFNTQSKLESVNLLDPTAVEQVIDVEREDLPRQLINSAVKQKILSASLRRDF